MPLKNYLCTSLSTSGNHYTVVFSPTDQKLTLKTQWNPALLTTTLSTMESELQTIYGGDATVDYNVTQFIGVSLAGEAMWAIALSAADSASADFRNYMKVMAYSNTTARTVATLNQSVTKVSGQNYAQPVSLLGYEYEKAYFGGYATGAAPNARVYEASASGVVSSPCNSATVKDLTVPAMLFSFEPYLVYGSLSGGNLAGYLLRKISGTWTFITSSAGSSPTLYPMSQIYATATSVGLAPTYVQGLGSNVELTPLAQGKDPFGTFSIDGATLTNLDTAGTVNMQSAYDGAVGGVATFDKTRQAFVYANFPIPPFWQNRVLADEIV